MLRKIIKLDENGTSEMSSRRMAHSVANSPRSNQWQYSPDFAKSVIMPIDSNSKTFKIADNKQFQKLIQLMNEQYNAKDPDD